MFCPKCGKEIPDDSRFCPLCGAAIAEAAPETAAAEAAPTEAPEAEAPEAPKAEAPKRKRKKTINSQKDIEGKKITENIYLCQDGVYRWVYELPMMKNPVILFTVWKVMAITFGIVFLLIFFIQLFADGLSGDSVSFFFTLLGIMAGIFLVLSVISYIILAAIYGWKYTALFEMDETEIRHIQVPKQQKKAEIIGLLTALAGLASKNLSTTGAGILAGTRTTSTTEFSRVKRIKPSRRLSTIKLSQGLSHNQIYADGEDFDFALEYLSERCVNRKK